jgi:hypothetical protein
LRLCLLRDEQNLSDTGDQSGVIFALFLPERPLIVGELGVLMEKILLPLIKDDLSVVRRGHCPGDHEHDEHPG